MRNLSKRRTRLAAATALTVVTVAGLAGCSGASSSGKVTITLAGPNQFTNDTDTFGQPWEDLVAAFEEENPDIEVETTVLPLSSWAQTLSAQLTAGTAPELIFSQTAHKPDQVKTLNEELAKPNPFSESDGAWIDDFKSDSFGGPDEIGTNVNGDYEMIPFNLVSSGIYYNQDVLDEVGVTTGDLETFSGFVDACTDLREAGYMPLGMDPASMYTGWPVIALGSMMLEDQYQRANDFDADGTPGSAQPVTVKGLAKGLLTGEVDMTEDPEFAAVFETLKEFIDACGSDNWSGIQTQGSFSGGTGFTGGRAAMAWGTNFSGSILDDGDFSWGMVPFPTVEKSDSEFASGEAARFGANKDGTAYMIPSYIDGDEYEAAITFLQFVTSPHAADWVQGTNSISSITAVPDAESAAALTEGNWSEMPPSSQSGGFFQLPSDLAGQNVFEGYLVGSDDLDEALATVQEISVDWAKEQAANSDWTKDWAQN